MFKRSRSLQRTTLRFDIILRPFLLIVRLIQRVWTTTPRDIVNKELKLSTTLFTILVIELNATLNFAENHNTITPMVEQPAIINHTLLLLKLCILSWVRMVKVSLCRPEALA